jgi:hypothetical protein
MERPIGQAHPRVARPAPSPRHQGVRPASPSPNAALSPINSPRWKTPKGRIAFPQNILQASPFEVSLSPTGSINLGFTTEGNLLLCSSYLPLGVPNWVLNMHYQAFFWHRCRGERKFLQGESLTFNLLLCYYFALFYFCLHLFVKNTKKLVTL